jgi:general stress protein 26
MSWQELANDKPELAAFGAERLLDSEVAYLATVRKDGSPRVHPVTPIIGDGRLFVFMEPTSPKGHDLRRNGRYAMHCQVADSEGGKGEFFLSGRAQLVEDAAVRETAVRAASHDVADRYILFELDVDQALGTTYSGEGPVRQRWQRPHL